MNIPYHLEHILYILAIALGPLSVMIWVIVGAPRVRIRKPWQQPKVFDTFAKADLEMFLDEHETKIS